MENDKKQFYLSPFFGAFLSVGLVAGLAVRNLFESKPTAIAFGLCGGILVGVLFEGYRFYKYQQKG